MEKIVFFIQLFFNNFQFSGYYYNILYVIVENKTSPSDSYAIALSDNNHIKKDIDGQWKRPNSCSKYGYNNSEYDPYLNCVEATEFKQFLTNTGDARIKFQ